MTRQHLPPELQTVQDRARRALREVGPAVSDIRQTMPYWLNAKRTDAGQHLPEPYLVYFLLVELLGFPHTGIDEKVAWTVPLEYQGQTFTVEHRKMGLGLFTPNPEAHSIAAEEIVNRIQKAVKEAQPFFDWYADQQVAASAINVLNHSAQLFKRYEFLRESAQVRFDDAEQYKDEVQRVTHQGEDGSTWSHFTSPSWQLRREGDWLALSAVEAFFSWTEHALIHLAILQGKIRTANEVAVLAAADWSTKFKTSFDLAEAGAKKVFDRMLAVRQDLRNHVAHGAFGKQGEALLFHSSAGAVPVLLPHRAGQRHFRFGHGLDLDARQVFDVIDEFFAYMFDGPREPARQFLLENSFSSVLTLVANGTYSLAMQSVEAMAEFLEHWSYEVDRAANMDW
jgi:hypothetical protein